MSDLAPEAAPAIEPPAVTPELDEHSRRRAAYIDECLHPPDHRWVGYLLVGALLAAVLGAALVISSDGNRVATDCEIPAAAGVDWSSCQLSGMKKRGAELSQANLRNVKLTDAVLPQARWTGADAAYAQLDRSDLSGGDFSGANLMGASLRSAHLAGVNFTDADLSYADFSGATLTGANIAGARLGNALWTDGSQCLPESVGRCLAVSSE